MKKLFVAAWALVALCTVSCSDAPDIDDLKEDSAPLVEQLVTEDNTEKLSYRLDRYILDGHPDKLTYTGTDYDKYTVNLYAND